MGAGSEPQRGTANLVLSFCWVRSRYSILPNCLTGPRPRDRVLKMRRVCLKVAEGSQMCCFEEGCRSTGMGCMDFI